MLCSFVCLQSHSYSCVSMLCYSQFGRIMFFFSIYSKDLKMFFNSYFQAPSFSLRNQSVIFFPKFRIWMLIYAILSHFEYPLPCPYFLKKLYFSYRQNQVCRLWNTTMSTQINKRNTICRQNHMLQYQWGHTNHIKSHRFHFRTSYLQLKRL